VELILMHKDIHAIIEDEKSLCTWWLQYKNT
jgi:hypothetical protein